jgi:hypothetical protein
MIGQRTRVGGEQADEVVVVAYHETRVRPLVHRPSDDVHDRHTRIHVMVMALVGVSAELEVCLLIIQTLGV